MNVASGNRRSPTAPDATESDEMRAGVITGIVLTAEQTLHDWHRNVLPARRTPESHTIDFSRRDSRPGGR